MFLLRRFHRYEKLVVTLYTATLKLLLSLEESLEKQWSLVDSWVRSNGVRYCWDSANDDDEL